MLTGRERMNNHRGDRLMAFENVVSRTSRHLSAPSQPGGRRDRRLRPGIDKLEERSLLSYTITDLGTLGGPVTEAMGLNNKGQVVGESETGAVDPFGNPVFHAFIWDSVHGMRDLGTMGGDLTSVAVAINDAGTIAGTSTTARVQKVNKKSGYVSYVWTDHAVTWSNGFQVQELADGSAFDINGAGEVVGTSNNEAMLWASGGATDLGTLGGSEKGSQSWAAGINSAGQVVGSAPINDSAQTQRPFLWSPKTLDGTKGTMKNLGTLDPTAGPSFSVGAGTSINAVGEVVGVSDDLEIPNAFLYSGGQIYDLGILGGIYNASQASSINDSGVVVGSAAVESGSNNRAWIWVPTSQNGTRGQMTDLNNLIPAGSGWTLTFAKSVNNSGEIAGFGTVNGQVHAFLLTPTTTSLAQPSIGAANRPAGNSVSPNPGGPVSVQRPDAPTALDIASLDPGWWGRSAEQPTNPVSPSSLISQVVDLALPDLAGHPRYRR
jgi:probable HAF family extracellular repeat protein